MFLRLASKSLLSRKGSVILAFFAICVSVLVLLGIEHLRLEAKNSFKRTVSGVDLIVGARTGNINLLLYSVFRLGSATNNISWETYQTIANNRNVAWTIPISLGDSHKGYRVIGTSQDYFEHLQFGQKQSLRFEQGEAFASVFDVVLGHEVAEKLNYQLGDKIVIAHGLGQTSFSLHDDKPFTVVGILEATGTPVDQSLHVSLAGIEAIHIDWQNGVKIPGVTIPAEEVEQYDLTPKSITAFMVGLQSRMLTFRIQRDINTYSREPLLAILPGVTLNELWQMISVMEDTLRLVSALVLFAALLGLSAMLLASIRERENEIAVMRAMGASPWFVLCLIEIEALLITFFASVFACLLLFLVLLGGQGFLATNFGLFLNINLLNVENLKMLGLVMFCSLVISAVPASMAFSKALQTQLR